MEALRLSCGGDGSATGEPPKIIGQWTTWTQTKSEVVRVKLWGAGGMGGAPARLVPEGGCQARRLRGRGRGRRGGYKGLGTRADLNNHANQMNPNNWRYWSSRGLQPPWRGGAVTGYNAAYPADTPVGIGVPYRPRQPEQTTQQQTQPTPERTKQARRGLPVAVARRFARIARSAARKWVPRERRWKVTDEDPDVVGPCGELWLCGGGGGGGAFTDELVNLTAGKKYGVEVLCSGFGLSAEFGFKISDHGW
ncbi:unnamed protein product [Symbiodinium natans]|uniref:Uncharacterized protein n=1 Tax=Symbiodinium natans TaxID=878477 RepID=A0A812JDQ3_9DINO|nr:unnamed protein product [Symbiodinium natans]